MDADQKFSDHKASINSQRQSNSRVWIVLALCAFLVVQGAGDIFARTAGGNAFPTIAMPGFGAKSVGTDGRAKATDRIIEVIDADGTSHEVTAETLLAPMPTASAVSTLNRIFDPAAKVAPGLTASTVEYLKKQTQRLDPVRNAVGLRLTWQPETFNIETLERAPMGPPTVREVSW